MGEGYHLLIAGVAALVCVMPLTRLSERRRLARVTRKGSA